MRTLQPRLEAAAIAGAIREPVPGGFRWLVPLEAVQGRVAEALPLLLEKLLPEFEAARTAETSRLDAERRRANARLRSRPARPTMRSCGPSSAPGGERLVHRARWLGGRPRLGSTDHGVQRTGIDFPRALRARSATERIAALDQLLRDLETAIRLCRSYQPADAHP